MDGTVLIWTFWQATLVWEWLDGMRIIPDCLSGVDGRLFIVSLATGRKGPRAGPFPVCYRVADLFDLAGSNPCVIVLWDMIMITRERIDWGKGEKASVYWEVTLRLYRLLYHMTWLNGDHLTQHDLWNCLIVSERVNPDHQTCCVMLSIVLSSEDLPQFHLADIAMKNTNESISLSSPIRLYLFHAPIPSFSFPPDLAPSHMQPHSQAVKQPVNEYLRNARDKGWMFSVLWLCLYSFSVCICCCVGWVVLRYTVLCCSTTRERMGMDGTIVEG